MNQNLNASAEAGPSSEPADFSRINELGELVCLVLNYCHSEPQATHYAEFAAEMGVPVDQAVAAAVAGTILKHYHVTPKGSGQRQHI
jgi:hypothetical protein